MNRGILAYDCSIELSEVFSVKSNSKKMQIPRPHRPGHSGVPALEWLSEVSGRTARITAVGSHRVLIENHTGIQDFSDAHVRLFTASGPLCIHGCDLSLCEVRRSALIVRGDIRQIDLPEEREAE